MLPQEFRDELMSLIQLHGLSPSEVSTLTEYSMSSVEAWLMQDRESARARPVPERAISLMKLKLEKAVEGLMSQEPTIV